MGKNEPEAKQWFAIRVTYSREMALKEYLDRCRMESFIPMSYKEVIKGERKVRKLVPVIHNLVFVRSTREKLDEIKRDISLKVPIRYIMDRETRRPLVVPDRQMHSFIYLIRCRPITALPSTTFPIWELSVLPFWCRTVSREMLCGLR